VRVPGDAVFLTGNPDIVPLSLLHNIKHNHVLHRRNIILSVQMTEAASVDPERRLSVEALSDSFYRVVGSYGYMEMPDVPELLASCAGQGLECDPRQASYFLTGETIVPGAEPGMAGWRKRLFRLLSRNAERVSEFFNLPPNRVVELGMQIQI
jgi:KUP system potassium uptake protein